MARTRKEIMQELADKVANRMEEINVSIWEKGIEEFMPINIYTNKEYKGMNAFFLGFLGGGTQEYATFNQIADMGGKVKKGAKSLPITYWKMYNKTQKRDAMPDDNDDDDVYMVLKSYRVFQIGKDTEGIEPKRKPITSKPVTKGKRVKAAEEFCKKFMAVNGIKYTEEHGTACYIPSEHGVRISPISHYKTPSHYIQTLFHELIHATSKGLHRKTDGGFGSKDYSKEEIVAEFGSAILCRYFGIKGQFDNSVAYIKGWSAKIRQNPDWLFNGANAAQRAVDYMLKEAGYDNVFEQVA